MGAYIYCLKTPKKNVAIVVDGQTAVASQLKYSHKPYSDFWGKPPRWQALANGRITQVERKFNGSTPRYAILVGDDGVKAGCRVIDWHSGKAGAAAVSTYDDPDWGGRKFIGQLDANKNVVPTPAFVPIQASA